VSTLPSRRKFLQTAAAALYSGPPSPPNIQLGCCVPLRQLHAVAAAGFDYIEPAAAELAELTPAQFEQLKNDVLASPIRCQAFNSFIRRQELAVVGPSVNLPAVKEYVAATLPRCRQLGATVVVWGSAGSRNVPPDFSRDRAWDQIAEFLQSIAPIAAANNIIVSIEPLNRKESNIFNTGREALRMVNQLNLPQIGMIIDYYHLRLESEDLDIFEQARGKITHLHFANPIGRRWPKTSDNDPLYPAFFDTLRRVGWTGGISVEGKGSLAADGAQCLEFFRSQLAHPVP
jgi:D-psicose/D-tagatose/L-ribulose 3-epimerase